MVITTNTAPSRHLFEEYGNYFAKDAEVGERDADTRENTLEA